MFLNAKCGWWCGVEGKGKRFSLGAQGAAHSNMEVYNRTWSHELTLPSAKRWERCHLPPHSPELQRLWWPDSECQAEETEMHGCHFLIFHCDNHNVCTESLRGNLWGRCAAGTSKMSACVHVKQNHNKHKHEARACENVCERREPSVYKCD